MDVEQLRAHVRAHPRQVVPFVGSGLVLDAGAPRADQLSRWLAARFGAETPHSGDLLRTTADLVREHQLPAVQTAVAEHLSGLRMRVTPALTAVSACARRVVVTTNYDDAVEVAARARGVEPIALLADDPRILQRPKRGTMHVVHAHGLLDRPDTLILPGRQMARLADNSPFMTFMRSTLASGNVLYLGFSLAAAELHLRGIVQWLDAQVPDAPHHWLLIPRQEVEKRSDELTPLTVTETLTVATFDAAAGYGPVEDVALALAPRVATAERDADEAERMTWVQPALHRLQDTDDPLTLPQRLRTFDLGVAREDPIYPSDLADRPRTVLVGGPGTGKTTLLHWLSRLTERPVAHGSLRVFVPDSSSDPARGLLRLLRDPDGAPLSAETWAQPNLVVALDGLEEVPAELSSAALGAIVAAADGRHLIVAARPTEHVTTLRDARFDVVHLVPSYRWADAYLRSRAVPRARVQRALLREHGLGDLLTVPLYAGLLADALLDDAAQDLSPLRLLVDAHELAIADEARRAGEPASALSRWARELALGLHLTGRTSVPLSALHHPADDEQRGRLVTASVLGDLPGHAAFIRRTSQEAFVADEILAAANAVAALRWSAVATVDGADRIRSDFDLVADLVFEHAEPPDRPGLRALDEFRWARTALGSHEAGEAEQAFTVLERWHEQRGVDWLKMFRRDGLRTAMGAVVSLLARWPAIGNGRITRWHEDLHQGSKAARLRAITALAALPAEPHGWLLPLLSDPEEAVQARAAAVAADRGIEEAIEPLLGLLASPERTVSRTALGALVELLPADELDRLGGAVRGSDPLRPIHERLEERITLDAGLRLLAARDRLDASDGWLLDRLVATAPVLAWTPERTAALMHACGHSGADADIDVAAIAAVVARRPEVTLPTVRLHYLALDPPVWRGAPQQMRVLAELPEEAFELHDTPDRLRQAIRYGLEEWAGIVARRTGDQAATCSAADAIDTDVDALDLLRILTMATANLDAARMDRLRAAVRRRWPKSLRPLLGDDEDDELLLEASAAVDVTLERDWWFAAVDAHLSSPYSFGVGSDRIGWWLASRRPAGVQAGLLQRLKASDDTRVPRVALLAVLEDPVLMAVRDAIVARLQDGRPDERWWRETVHHLSARADADILRQLVALAGETAAADELRAELARAGSEEAAVELITRLTARMRAGEPFVRPWLAPDAQASLERIDALAELAEAVLDTDAEALSWAVGSIRQAGGSHAVEALSRLADLRPNRWWLADARDDAAQVLATTLVRERLPADVRAAAAAFAAERG